MALWQRLFQQTEPDANTKRGTITVKDKVDQTVIGTESQDFPIDTGDGYIKDTMLLKSKLLAERSGEEIPRTVRWI